MSVVNSTGIESQIKAALPSLWRFALQITRDNHDAEDLVQRACLRALERKESYEEMQKSKSWLFRIAQNIWKNEIRSRSIREKGFGFVKNDIAVHNDHSPATQEFNNQTPEAHLELQDVVRAVESLPEAQRMVMILVAVSGFSYAEAAHILDVPIGTIMSRLARARLTIGNQFVSPEITSDKVDSPQSARMDRSQAVKLSWRLK